MSSALLVCKADRVFLITALFVCKLLALEMPMYSAAISAASKLCQQQLNREMLPRCEGFVREKHPPPVLPFFSLSFSQLGKAPFACDLSTCLHVSATRLPEKTRCVGNKRNGKGNTFFFFFFQPKACIASDEGF